VDSRSFAPVLDGGPQRWESVYAEYMDVQRMVLDGRYKLIYDREIDRTQLFDLDEDPHEMNDLSGEPGQRERTAALRESLRDWHEPVQ